MWMMRWMLHNSAVRGGYIRAIETMPGVKWLISPLASPPALLLLLPCCSSSCLFSHHVVKGIELCFPKTFYVLQFPLNWMLVNICKFYQQREATKKCISMVFFFSWPNQKIHGTLLSSLCFTVETLGLKLIQVQCLYVNFSFI